MIICIFKNFTNYSIMKLKDIFPEVLSSKLLRETISIRRKVGTIFYQRGSNPKSWWKK